MLCGVLGVVTACSPAEVDIPLDQDGDGILSNVEALIGTDPTNSDSDEDGFMDGEEIDMGTDPTDAGDRPYLGGWPMDPCADEIVETGYDQGDIAPDFDLIDQFGDPVRLYDFCDHTVLLASAAFW
jgi:hypothetical protein